MKNADDFAETPLDRVEVAVMELREYLVTLGGERNRIANDVYLQLRDLLRDVESAVERLRGRQA